VVAAAELDPESRLIQMWLRARSRHTIRAYKFGMRLFRHRCSKPLHEVRFDDLSAFAEGLVDQKMGESSIHGTLSAVKSFFAFAARIGFLPFDVSSPLRLARGGRELLNERILSEDEIIRVIDAADTGRNRLIMEMLYFCGLRVSELTGLRGKDCIAIGDAGQITVFGKGSKTRSLLLDGDIWIKLMTCHRPADPSDAEARMFPISTSQICRIVRNAAIRAGIAKPVSPHWFRHCYCSHAIDRGAPISLVQRDAGHSSVAVTSRYLHARPKDSAGSFLPKIPRRQGGER